MPDTVARDRLVAAIVAFLGADDLLPLDDVRDRLEREIDAAGHSAVLTLKARLQEDNGWGYYERDPLARQIHHLLADRFLSPGSCACGIEHLAERPSGPLVIVSNHLSYADANVIEVLLQRSGAGELADRLTVLAGPKVFTDRRRRFSSLCFGTIKVPQSSEVSSEEAKLNAREVARAARQSIDTAMQRLGGGDALLLFGEGTRSRTGAMQPMLAGAARYLDRSETSVLPVALTGCETLFPIADGRLRPATVTLHIGHPVSRETLAAGAERDRQRTMDRVGRLVADLLPDSFRGVYASA